MAKRRSSSVFNTSKRIRLGIWGLGRGMSFYQACNALHFDVVAGCDYNAHMRKNFLEANPGAFATDDADEFLAQDVDAILLATFCPAHADDAIRCLEAGKHVLSEVTAFHTMAEGVALVEAVERSGRIYNLAENYPFSAPQTYLAKRWREGLFGDLQYAEGEYVHDIRSLAFTYIDGTPVNPGYRLHNWRSWLNFHYYCTHSLGPVMHITGTRPVRVSALPAPVGLPALIPGKEMGMAGITPSLIAMDNGALVRNLMGNTTNDVHQFRYWGTKGSAEIGHDGLQLRLGGHGYSPKLNVDADWGELTPLAEKMGHGGGDF
ncbi:MAG: Gfo/Idh/MocA family oxidoreductase, partial [bacterium]|nr:Gfo/Idh/MocA family oxidoreductase [bacterium]